MNMRGRLVMWAYRTDALDTAAIIIAVIRWGFWGLILVLGLIVPVYVVSAVVVGLIDATRQERRLRSEEEQGWRVTGYSGTPEQIAEALRDKLP